MENYNLSQGALETIMRGDDYTQQPIIQVLGSTKVVAGSSDKQRYRVLLSDGKHTVSLAMLSIQTNETFGPAGVSPFSVIRVKRFVTSVVNNPGKGKQRVLLVLDLEIIVSGEEIGRKIGSPESLNCDMENYNLSQGALEIIMRGGDYTQPIIQVLGCKNIVAESLYKEKYRVLLSDGKHTVSFAMLFTQSERFGAAGVPPFSVIRVERFATCVVNNASEVQRVLLVLDFKIIVPGQEIGKKIGSPEPFSTTSVCN